MRVRHDYKFISEFTPDFFDGLQRVYDYFDEGPTWNRVIEVYQRDNESKTTYVVTYGAPDFWGNRQIQSVVGYKHYDD